MSKRMLIDASHREETRVVVLDGSKVEEFDFEAASKRPLKGNIYLAKVTRVEPSLQAAFVEYGGNRQGFLAFNEIHPDYYQIPVADREALLEEQQREARRHAEEEGFESVETGTNVRSDEELEAEDAAEADEEPASTAEEPSIEETADEISDAANETADDDEVFDNKRGTPTPGDIAESEVESGFDAAQADFEGEHHDHDEDHHEHHHDNPLHEIAEREVEDGIVDQQTISEAGDAPEAIAHGEEYEHAHDDFTEQPAMVDAEVESGLGIADEQAAAEAAAEDGSEQSAQPLRAAKPSQRWVRRRHYKIQEVIKRKQIMLVQVVKEERGNKGAALTTYMSLAGRYCVLMPNTPRGGGISRKITNPNDRKRLKQAAAALDLPQGMGLIIRTAGESRTKLEIKRDYEYLLRLWDQIRELTLESNAPACVYEEGDLIKRVIRDLYTKDVEEIIVEGDEGYKNAKEFMRMLMPGHAKNVKHYIDTVPLYSRMNIEAQLDSMFQPTVTLRSGGYIVINQTEALVSIDVNSGRATREHSIEETAHKTNLEAADEIGRQLRLRDLAGLIVIDFIDMEDSRNDRHVEKRLRDAVKNDRARIQVGKISQFGLMEMSRQRLRAGVVAGSTITCPHCGGQGIVRSVESTALRVLRGIEEEGQKQRAASILVKVTPDVAIYALNKKRQEIARLETEYGMAVNFEPTAGMMTGTFEIERTAQRSPDEKPRPIVSPESVFAEIPADMSEDIEEDVEEEEEDEEEIEEPAAEQQHASEPEDRAEQRPQNNDSEGGNKRRRRRRGGRNRNRDQREQNGSHQQNNQQRADQSAGEPTSDVVDVSVEHEGEPAENAQHASERQNGDGSGQRRRRRRRGRRGGNRDGYQQQNGQSENGEHKFQSDAPVVPNAESAPSWSLSQSKEPQREQSSAPVAEATAPEQPSKKGWWQRAFGAKD
jgi:ribonuclease E